MIITDLKNLDRKNNSELYDLREISFRFRSDVFNQNVQEYVVGEFEEMRMDLLCDNLYNDVDKVDVLCNLNDIFNPLSIKSGNIIKFVDESNIPAFRPDRENNRVMREVISNERKKGITDVNRSKYLEEQSQSLPPTMTKSDYSAVKYKDGKVSIGKGIFSS